MRRDCIGRIALAFWRYLAVLLLLMSSSVAFSQGITLTPEQQAMLNQLPPAQRQEALRRLEELGQTGRSPGGLSSLSEEPTSPPQSRDAGDEDLLLADEEPRAEGSSALVINLNPKFDLSAEQQSQLAEDAALKSVRGSHFYTLTESGVLALPGLPEIPLLGLTAEQIERRLLAEPSLNLFDVAVAILDSIETGSAALEPFGYELFESAEFEFAPVTTGPVPADYVLGPGDSVRAQLFGNVNEIYEFEVSRDGILNLPQLGPVTVSGLPFSEFRADINRRVQQMLIGTQVSVTMGRLRSIRIFVLGDANRPGSYIVNSLATISSVLYRSGGVSPVGSMRDIQLKRGGDVVSRFDAYDLLLFGDTSGDSRLQPGDVIFIPPVGPQIGVGGAVKRPAIYEVRNESSVVDIVGLAGGLTPDAYPAGATLERIETGRRRTVVSIDANSSDATNLSARAGDTLTIPRVLPVVEDSVTLQGHVYRPGPYQWRPGMRLSDLIEDRSALQPGVDDAYILIRRVNQSDQRVSVVSANLAAALDDPRSNENIALRPLDTVQVFSLEFGRQRVVQPILEELKLQARFGEPYLEVSISGQVHSPGAYPLEPGMRVSDLIRAGGNLAEDAYSVKAELVRYEVVGNDFRNTEIIDIDLEGILSGTGSADLALQEHDNLRISGLPDWDSLWTVTLEGEFMFPGDYRIRRGETLSDLLERAGGLSNAAFPEGAIFLRESLRAREQEQIEVLARRLESDLISLSLQTGDSSSVNTQSTGQSLLTQLRSTEAVGRLVINLDQLESAGNKTSQTGDLELRDGDRLLVPKIAQEVTVIGETQQNTSHLYQPGLSRDDYVAMSGGLTRRADKKLVYVVRASGAVVAGGRSRWFTRRDSAQMRPGDTIVVPLETDKIRPLTLWTNVTQILYQAAIAVSAVRTFDN
ncbi:MAG: SLBB domain-containing protein [Woeseiaceae bacterium]